MLFVTLATAFASGVSALAVCASIWFKRFIWLFSRSYNLSTLCSFATSSGNISHCLFISFLSTCLNSLLSKSSKNFSLSGMASSESILLISCKSACPLIRFCATAPTILSGASAFFNALTRPSNSFSGRIGCCVLIWDGVFLSETAAVSSPCPAGFWITCSSPSAVLIVPSPPAASPALSAKIPNTFL